MCIGCSKEPPHWDGSFEYQQHMFWMRNKETNFPIRTLFWRPAFDIFSHSLKVHAHIQHVPSWGWMSQFWPVFDDIIEPRPIKAKNVAVRHEKILISLGNSSFWSVSAVRTKKVGILRYPLSAQRRLWSDWADALVDLSLRWSHTHFVMSILNVWTAKSRASRRGCACAGSSEPSLFTDAISTNVPKFRVLAL